MTNLDTVAPGLCVCGVVASKPHRCRCRRVQLVPVECGTCAAEGLDDCAAPEEHMRPITAPAKACGCLVVDVCNCGELSVGTAMYGRSR